MLKVAQVVEFGLRNQWTWVPIPQRTCFLPNIRNSINNSLSAGARRSPLKSWGWGFCTTWSPSRRRTSAWPSTGWWSSLGVQDFNAIYQEHYHLNDTFVHNKSLGVFGFWIASVDHPLFRWKKVLAFSSTLGSRHMNKNHYFLPLKINGIQPMTTLSTT